MFSLMALVLCPVMFVLACITIGQAYAATSMDRVEMRLEGEDWSWYLLEHQLERAPVQPLLVKETNLVEQLKVMTAAYDIRGILLDGVNKDRADLRKQVALLEERELQSVEVRKAFMALVEGYQTLAKTQGAAIKDLEAKLNLSLTVLDEKEMN